MTWIILTDTNRCKIFHYKKNADHLILLKELYHPENKLKNSDLVSDKSGHYQTRGSARGAYSPHKEAKDIKIDEFTREISHELNQGRANHQYEQLIIIAPPHMNGLLYNHLNKHVIDCVINNLQKDLLHLSDHELKSIIQDHVQKADL